MAKIIVLAATVALFLAPLFFTTILKILGKKVCKNGFRPFAPNWITVYSFILTAVGFYFYLTGKPVWGIAIAVYGAMLDHIDGKMARALKHTLLGSRKDWYTDKVGNVFADVHFPPASDMINIFVDVHFSPNEEFPDGEIKNVQIGRATTKIGKWWLEFNFPGRTGLGEVFDPFVDKVKALSILAYFSFWADILDPWLVGVIIAPEVVGTLIRRPFWEKFSVQDKASWVGKTKATMQWISIICCVVVELCHAGKTNWPLMPNSILGLTILFAVGSVFSRLDLKKLLACSKAYLEGQFKRML